MANKQFPNVPDNHNPPFKRPDIGSLDLAVGKIQLFKVTIRNSLCDTGGAYWGIQNTPDDTLFCARDSEGNYRKFIRTKSRFHACFELGIEPVRLVVPLSLPEDISIIKEPSTEKFKIVYEGRVLFSEFLDKNDAMKGVYELLMKREIKCQL